MLMYRLRTTVPMSTEPSLEHFQMEATKLASLATGQENLNLCCYWSPTPMVTWLPDIAFLSGKARWK